LHAWYACNAWNAGTMVCLEYLNGLECRVESRSWNTCNAWNACNASNAWFARNIWYVWKTSNARNILMSLMHETPYTSRRPGKRRMPGMCGMQIMSGMLSMLYIPGMPGMPGMTGMPGKQDISDTDKPRMREKRGKPETHDMLGV